MSETLTILFIAFGATVAILAFIFAVSFIAGWRQGDNTNTKETHHHEL